MQASPGFICDYRTRCKYCKGLPKFYTTIAGIPYHSDYSPEGTHRGQHDLTEKRPFGSSVSSRSDHEYGKAMRGNSVRGTASFSTYVTKNKNDDYGSYRFIISCTCGRSLWMYPGPNDNYLFKGKKRLCTIDHYKWRGWNVLSTIINDGWW